MWRTDVFGGVQPLTVEAETTSETFTEGDLSYVKVDEDEDGTYDYVEITDCENNVTEVEIPSEIEGLAVESIGWGSFASCDSLKSIIIPDSITSIAGQAFLCTALSSINVSENNYFYSSIDGVLFNNDKTELIQYPIGKEQTEYTIPDIVTSIGDSAFSYCDSLTSVTIPESVANIGGYAFEYCSSLESIVIPDSVTSIEYNAFSCCDSLISVAIGDSVTSIGNSAFSNCTGLASITIPNSITYIGYDAFYKTPWLETKQTENPLVVENNILIDGTMCKGDVVIPEGVTNIGTYVFYDVFFPNTNITGITIPDSVTSIADAAFNGCASLENITIPDSVTSIGGGAFSGTPWLEAKQIKNPLVIVNNILVDGENCEGNVVIPDGVNTISGSAFSNCEGLVSVTIPNSVKSIGDRAFSNCINLGSIIIPDSVTSIEESTFSNCTLLKDVKIPEGIKHIGDGAFYRCKNLLKVEIPKSVEYIGSSAFSVCSNLNEIIIYNSNCDIGSCHHTKHSDICSRIKHTISNEATPIPNSGNYNINYFGTIYGYTNSTAQAYAEECEYNFVALDEPELTETPNGDANGDGKVNVRDAATIASAMANGTGNTLPLSADFNGDGKVNVRDAAAIAAALANGEI